MLTRFVRAKSSPNSPRQAVQVVHSVLDGDKVRQKIVRHFGMAETDEELEELWQMALAYIHREVEYKDPSILKPEQTLTDLQRASIASTPSGLGSTQSTTG